jgi:hypothetical protein
MAFKKHHPRAALLVEVDAKGKVVWAHDYKSGKINKDILHSDDKKLKLHSHGHLVSPVSGSKTLECSDDRCVWKLISGQWKCVP